MSLAGDTNATVAHTDGVGGILSISTGDAVDNNEAAVSTATENFKFAADAPIFVEAKIQYTEHNTSAANVAFGLADAFGVNLINDNGGTITASSAVLIYKKDGETFWRAYSENNGVSTDTISTTTAGGAAYQRLSIEVLSVTALEIEITFYVDGQPLRDTLNRPIKHRQLYASTGEMDLGVYGKAGGLSNHTILVDYIYGAQRRIN